MNAAKLFAELAPYTAQPPGWDVVELSAADVRRAKADPQPVLVLAAIIAKIKPRGKR